MNRSMADPLFCSYHHHLLCEVGGSPQPLAAMHVLVRLGHCIAAFCALLMGLVTASPGAGPPSSLTAPLSPPRQERAPSPFTVAFQFPVPLVVWIHWSGAATCQPQQPLLTSPPSLSPCGSLNFGYHQE